MAFAGIGGGVNLGSATGYLFIDGKGMRSGLNTAKGALDDFAAKARARSAAVAAEAVRVTQATADSAGRITEAQARSAAKVADAEARRRANVGKVTVAEAEKVAAAQKKAADAAAQAGRTKVLGDPATQKQVAALTQRVADANANATRVIGEGYRERTLALKALTGATQVETAKQIAAQERLNVAIERQTALQKKQKDLQAALARKGVPPADRAKTGAALGGTTTALKRADTEVAAARANLTNVAAAVDATLKGMSTASARTIQASLDAEKNAVNESRKAIGQQAKEFERLGNIAGKSGLTAANAVKKTGQEIVKANDAFFKINQQITRQQEITASSTGEAQLRSLEKEKALMAQRVAALDRVRNAEVAYAQSAQQFSNTIAQVATKDAAVAAAAAESVVVAKEAEATAVLNAQIVENNAVAKVKADETAKVIALQATEAQGVTKIKDAEASKVIAAAEAEAAALNNVNNQAIGSVLQGATFATVALGAAAFATTSAFVGFDEQLHNIASISKDTNFVFGEMRDKIEALSVARGQGPEDLSKALYDIVSSGFDADQALTILDASSKAAVAGLTDVGGAGKSITAVINAYKNATGDLKKTWEDATSISDVAFASVREGVFTFAELTQQQGDNLSIAAELGVSYEELAASYVVLTKAGNSLSESTTQVNGLLRTFIKPNEALAAAIDGYGESVLHVTGLTGAMLVQTYGFGAALQFVSEVTKGNVTALGELFPNVRALRGEIGIGGRNLQEYTHQLKIMESASLGVGATQRAFGIQAEATAFKLRQAKEEVRLAAIELGEHFAPGILFAAQAAGSAARVFAGLPDPIQAAIGGFGGFSLAMSASVLVVGNLIKAVKSGKDGVDLLTTAIKNNAAAQRILALSMNPAVLAIAALAFVGYKLYQSNKRNKKAVEELNTAYENLANTIKQLDNRPDINAREKESLASLDDELNSVIADSEALSESFDEASLKGMTTEITVGFDEMGNAITKTVGSFREFQDLRDDIALDNNEKKLLAVDFETIITTPDLDVDFVVSEIARLHAEAKSGVITWSDYAVAVHDMATNTDDLTKTARAAALGEVELGKSLRNVGEFFGTDADRADEFRKGLQALIDETSALAGVGFDFSSPLAFIQSAIGGVGDSMATTLLKAEALGHVKFTDVQRSALQALSAMDQWQAKIDEVNASIDASQGKMGEWQDLIHLVSESVGTAANGYGQLNELLRRGKITQQQYNDIKEAAIFLNERSKLGIEDEQAAIALSLPDLAAFVNEHDLAVQKYDKLDPAARGFASALLDAKNQAVIMTAVMVNLAHALDPENFPTSFVTTFIANVSSADPTIGALLDKMDLIPADVRTQLILDADQPLDTLDQVEARQKVVLDQLVAINKTPAGEQSEEQLAQAQALGREYKRLEDLKVTIPIDVTTDPSATPKIDSGIADTVDESESAAVAISDAFASANADIDDVGHSIAAVLPDLIRASTAADDFSDPFAFLQKRTGVSTDNFAHVLLRAEELGKVSFTSAERSALSLQSRLFGVTAGIERLDAQIQQNQGDMAMWQGRIDLIDATIGSATDTYAEYEAQLARGEITQEQFNEAVASGDAHRAYAELTQLVKTHRLTQEQADAVLAASIHLRERSVGGILDERAETALALIDLDNFVTAHDNLEGKYKTLTTEQKGFLAALKDEAVQTALNSYLMLSFLEVMNKLPKGTADNFAKMTAAGNPAVAAVFEELGILGKGADIPLTADVTDASTDIQTVKNEAAEGATLPVTTELDGTAVDTSQGTLPDQSYSINVDTATATAKVDDLTQHTADQVALMLEHGTSGAVAWVDGFVAGVEFKEVDVLGALYVIETDLINETIRVRPLGARVGQAYDYGIADGVYAYESTVARAGSYIGQLLFASTMIALLARSPSRKGMDVGKFYMQGIGIGLQNEAPNAAAKAAAAAKSIHGAFSDEMLNHKRIGIDDMLGGQPIDTRGGVRPMTTGQVLRSSSSIQTVGDIHVTVQDSGNPQATAKAVTDSVWQELHGSLRRLRTQV